MAAALNDTMDLLHNHSFYHHVLSLPPNNITLTRVFRPIYCTLTAVEQDAYKESDLRLVNRISSPPPILPIPAPRAPSPALSLETPASSLLSATTTLLDDPTDPHPAFHQGRTASYPTLVSPQDPPVWAHNPQQLLRLIVLTAMPQGIFVSTARNTSVLTAASVPLATLSTVVFETIVLFATASATPPTTVQTDFVPFAMTWDTLSPSTREIWRDSDLAPVVQVFKGGNVTIQGSDLLFSIICLPPLLFDSPFTFTVSIMFSANTFRYTIQ